MTFHPLRAGVYVLLLMAGWAAGRWVWRGAEKMGAVEPAPGAGTAVGAERLPADSRQAQGPAKKALAGKTVDGKAVGLELRAAGSESAFRDRARLMALEPPPALMDFLGAVSDSETVRQVLLEDAVQWAYCRDPEKGLALLSSLGGREEIRAMTEKTLHFFPPKDLPVVMAWFRGLPEAGLKAAARGELIKVLVGQDFRQAVALVAAMPHGTQEQMQDRHDELGGVWGMLTPAQRRDIQGQKGLGLVPEDEAVFTKNAQSVEIRNLMQHDKEAVVEKLVAGEAGLSPQHIESFFAVWAGVDPIRAAKGLEKLPENRTTPQTYLEFAAKWAKGNVGMASQWVKDLPEGAGKQAGVQGLVGSLAADYPAEAVIWAGTLTDPRVKISELRRVLAGTGAGAGPAAKKVREAVAGLNLTPEEQAELNRTITP